ncbi:adhesion G-protein coupled receptor G7-like [Chanos chanos]|uniref:Adhesion G-protein coupled receptor G7-like n=1 Tax=Chanos chanos TaxID=29144 RepID=A0A6J2W3T2_CHACN|nr:adhesion G-protein coupled receptor G7-like [Chanos chanos]
MWLLSLLLLLDLFPQTSSLVSPTSDSIFNPKTTSTTTHISTSATELAITAQSTPTTAPISTFATELATTAPSTPTTAPNSTSATELATTAPFTPITAPIFTSATELASTAPDSTSATELATTAPDSTFAPELASTAPDSTFATELASTAPDSTFATELASTAPDSTFATELASTAPDSTFATELASTAPNSPSTTELASTALNSTSATDLATTAPFTPITAPNSTSATELASTAPNSTSATELASTAPDSTSTTDLASTAPDSTSATELASTAPDSTYTTDLASTAPDSTSATDLASTAPNSTSTTELATTAPSTSTTAPIFTPTIELDTASTPTPDSVTTSNSYSGTNSTTINTTAFNSASPINNTTAFSTPNDMHSTTTVVTPTTTLPECENGGVRQHGVCICPDKWTGDTCSIENFCNRTNYEGFNFTQTVVGLPSYSEEKCPPGTTNAGISMASARCLNINMTPHFGSIQMVQCDETLDSIQTNVSSATLPERQMLASRTQILTSRPERLTPQNITTAAQIASDLLSMQVTKEIAEATITTVSQLMNANVDKFSNESVTERLTKTLEMFSVKQNSTNLLIQPNLAVQSVQVPNETTTGIQFTALTGEKRNKAQSRQNSNISVGFVLYENDRFFKSGNFQSTLGTKRRVISATLGNGIRAEYAEFRLLAENTSTYVLHDFACVFWDYSGNDWSTQGCSKVSNSSGNLQCRCNHTTNFAVLVSHKTNYAYAKALSGISIAGCTLSIVGLSITVIFHIMTRKSRGSKARLLMVSICVSMIISYFLFIFGIDNPIKQKQGPNISKDNTVPTSDLRPPEPDQGPCTAFAALLQYFLLATFTWNALYAANVFLLLKRTLSHQPRSFQLTSLLIGWGLPAVIVAISLAATYRKNNPLGYRSEEFCWLAYEDQTGNFDPKKPMLWGFLIPLALMIIFNISVVVYFSFTTCKENPLLTSNRVTSVKKKILSSLSLAVVLGVSWVFGYLVLVNHNALNVIFSALFCVCCSTQGVQIFILFTARTKVFKKSVSTAVQKLPPPEIGLHKKSFTLRKKMQNSERETYTPTESEFSSYSQTPLGKGSDDSVM